MIIQHTIDVTVLGMTFYLPDLAHLNWFLVAYHVLILLVNAGLYVYAAKIIRYFNSGQENSFQIALLRGVNGLYIILTFLDLFISFITEAYENYFFSFAHTLLIIYIAAIVYNLLSFLGRRKFGRLKQLDGKTKYIDTYNSRLIEILLMFIISFLAFYLLIQAWGLTSMLETTGLLGLIVAFLALTNNIWAPDPYYCMVILSSNMIEDGDVVRINDDPNEYIIVRVTFIYTLLFNVKNNHKTLMRNSKLIDQRIENLSKMAATDGLRNTLTYKIGYPEIDGTFDINTHESHQKQIFLSAVKNMFEFSEQKAFKDNEVKVNDKVVFEWVLSNTGNYALEFTLAYYLSPLPETKLTRVVRDHLYKTRTLINSYVYEGSIKYGLELATPNLLLLQNKEAELTAS